MKIAAIYNFYPIKEREQVSWCKPPRHIFATMFLQSSDLTLFSLKFIKISEGVGTFQEATAW